jgi:hypothetical protein
MRNLRQAVKLVIDSYSGTVTGQIMTDLRTAGQFIHNDIGTGDAETNLVDLAIQVYADYIDTPTGQRTADEISALAKILAEYEITPTGQRITDIVNLCKAIVNEGWVGFFSNKHYLNFDGVDDYAQLGESCNSGTTNMMSFWIKRDDETNLESPLGSSGYDHYVVYVTGSAFYFRVGTSAKNFGNVLPDTDLHHLVMIRNGDTIDCYRDGVYFGTQTGFGGVEDSEFDIIGAKYDTPPTFHFAGGIDEIAVYNDNIPAVYVDAVPTEVTELYGEGTPETCGNANDISGLQGYWRMEEGEGTTIADSVGDNDGTLINGVEWGEH